MTVTSTAAHLHSESDSLGTSPTDTGPAESAPRADEPFLDVVELPDLEYACTTSSVSFDQLVDAAYSSQPSANLPPDVREAYKRYLPRLSDTFSKQHDGISRSYYATNVRAAAVLTNDKELFLKLPEAVVNDVEAVGLLSRLTLLHIRARQYLDREDYQACLDPVFQVIVYCLSVFDVTVTGAKEPEAGRRRPALMDLLASESGRAERNLWDQVSRKAMLQYFYGMLLGLLVLMVLVPLLYFAPPLFPSSSDSTVNDLVQWAAVGGAFGAFISVLQRITSGKFSLSRDTVTLGHRRRFSVLHVLGALRPVVGAVLGIVFFAFQGAGLIPFDIREDVDQTVYFTAMGFLVGFSERFARDMVLSAEGAGLPPDSRVVRLDDQVYPTPGAEVRVDRTSPQV